MDNGITLVLGGIGVRGIANIGVLKVLRTREVRVKRIVATGINAIIGAHFGLGRDLDELADRIGRFFSNNHRYLWGLERLSGIPKGARRWPVGSIDYFLRQRLFCEVNMRKTSILPGEMVKHSLEALFGEKTTDDLKISVSIGAIDLDRQKEVLLSTGRLTELVRVGISFPGLFPPVKIGGKEYISSVLYCELPLGQLTPQDAPVLAIDLPHTAGTPRPKSLFEILARTDEVRSQVIKKRLLSRADMTIRLESIRSFSWGNYRRIPQLIARAQQELEDKIDASLAASLSAD